MNSDNVFGSVVDSREEVRRRELEHWEQRLRRIGSSLVDAFAVSQVRFDRESPWEFSAEYGRAGNWFGRKTGNVFLSATDRGITATITLCYRELGLLAEGLREEYRNGSYALVGEYPGFATVEQVRDTSCGNRYTVEFDLSGDDSEVLSFVKRVMVSRYGYRT
jgi:hypothetical protein